MVHLGPGYSAGLPTSSTGKLTLTEGELASAMCLWSTTVQRSSTNLSAPLLRTVKSLFYSFFLPPKSFTQLLSSIIFSEASVFPFLLIFYCHAFLDSWCSSQALVALNPPQVPYLEQAAAHVGGEVHWDRIGHRQTAHWVKLSLLINEWPKMTTHRVQGKHVFTYSCVTQGHLIEPFPAIPPPETSFELSLYIAIFFFESQVFQMSQNTSISEKTGMVVTDTSLSLSYTLRSCFHLLHHQKLFAVTFLMVAASNAAHNPCSAKPPGLKQEQASFTHFTSKTP